MPVITGLFVYPIKSCRGSSLDTAVLDERGIRYDRRWMVVDEHGWFVTQRDHPELARIIPWPTDDGLAVEIDGDVRVRAFVPHARWENGDRVPVTVWKHNGVGVDQGRDAAEFFSSHLHQAVRLVYMPDDHVRTPNRRPDGVTANLGFADGYPLLLTTERSLAELNDHIPADHAPIPMERFRPNITVSGAEEPWEEERWNQLVIDDVLFHGVKPCERCPITQTDQRTGERTNKEPLKTLARIHRHDNAALFGANLIHADLGTMRVGSPIENIVYGKRPGL